MAIAGFKDKGLRELFDTGQSAKIEEGTLLKELYLAPQNVSLRALSEATGVSRKHLSRIVNGHARISAQVAMKLAAVLETTPELWINAQRNVDLYDARQGLKNWQPQKVLSARNS